MRARAIFFASVSNKNLSIGPICDGGFYRISLRYANITGATKSPRCASMPEILRCRIEFRDDAGQNCNQLCKDRRGGHESVISFDISSLFSWYSSWRDRIPCGDGGVSVRILFATGSRHLPDQVGGAERSIHTLLDLLRENGHPCEAVVGLPRGARRKVVSRVRLVSLGIRAYVTDRSNGYQTRRTLPWLVPKVTRER